MFSHIQRAPSLAGAAGTMALVAGTITGQLPAGAATVVRTEVPPAKSAAVRFVDSSYLERMRASAIQLEVDPPQPVVTGVGYSAVNLEKKAGTGLGNCEILGGGYWLTDVLEDGSLGRAGRPYFGNLTGGYRNPTVSKASSADLPQGAKHNAAPPELHNPSDGSVLYTVPAHGNGVRWEANCDNDVKGVGTGNNVDLAWAEAAGSTTEAALDKDTGVYVGTSRSYVAGLRTATGNIHSITSLMQVKQLPGQQPTVTYRISLLHGGDLVSGANVPLQELTAQFNDQLKRGSAALSGLGPQGITLVGPTVSTSGDDGRYVLNAPFLEVSVGLDARKGRIGQNQRLRIANTDFDGLYNGGAIQEPGTAGE